MKEVTISQLLELGLGPMAHGVGPSPEWIHTRLFRAQSSIGVMGEVLQELEFSLKGRSGGVPRPIAVPALIKCRNAAGIPIRKECLLQILNGPHFRGNNIVMEVDFTHAQLPETGNVTLAVHCGDTALGSLELAHNGSQRICIHVPEAIQNIWRREMGAVEGVVVELPLALLSFRLEVGSA